MAKPKNETTSLTVATIQRMLNAAIDQSKPMMVMINGKQHTVEGVIVTRDVVGLMAEPVKRKRASSSKQEGR